MMKPGTHVFIGVIAASVVWAFIYESKQPEAPSRQSATQPAPQPTPTCPPPGAIRNGQNPDEYAAYDRCTKRCRNAYNKCIEKMCSSRAALVVPTVETSKWVRTRDEDANCAMACMYTYSDCTKPCMIVGVD